MPDQALHYASYLLRCWEEESQTPHHAAVWRFSLEDVQTGTRYGFSDLVTLMAFLHARLRPAPNPGSDVSHDD